MATERNNATKWLVVASLWAVGCLNYMDRQAIFSVFPLLRNEFSMSNVQLSLLGSAFLWAYSIASPAGGYLGDRYSRKAVILSSLLVFSLSTLATGFVFTSGQLIGLRVLLGISEAVYLPAALAFIADHHSGRTRSTAIGIHQTSLLIGGVLGGFLGGYMGDHYGWRDAFYLLGASGVLLALVLGPSLREIPKGSSDFSHSGEIQNAPPPPFGETIRTILRTPTVLCIMFCGLSVSATGWAVLTWMPSHLYERFGMSLALSGFNATFYVSAATIGGLLGGSILADRCATRNKQGRMFVQLFGLALAAPAALAIGFVGTIGALLVLLVIHGLGRGMWDCNNMPIFCEVVPVASRSSTYGVFNFANTVGGGLGVLLTGALRESLGLDGMLSAFSLLLFISGGLTLVTLKRFLPHDMRKLSESRTDFGGTAAVSDVPG